MKRAYILILTIIAGWQYVASAGDGSRFEKFVDACVSLRDGIEAKDRYAVMDARAAFVEVKAIPYSFFDVAEGRLREPQIRFNEVYCDSLLASDFRLVSLAELTAMRDVDDTPGNIYYMEASLEPSASVTLSYFSSNSCALAVVGSAADVPLKVETVCDGKPVKLWSGLKDTRFTADWTAPAYNAATRVRITNTSVDRPVTFVMAIK